jgi:hypothetical protein
MYILGQLAVSMILLWLKTIKDESKSPVMIYKTDAKSKLA